jgi:SAM-dependent methyltransferase
MDYDEAYRETAGLFGPEPDEILKVHIGVMDRTGQVLDVGAGQGRNALFLAREGVSVDAVDPSAVAVEILSSVAKRENLPLRAHRCGFEDFDPQVPYGAVLLLGLIPELPRDSIRLLLERIDKWTVAGGLAFATAFTTGDPAFAGHSAGWRTLGENSFTDDEGTIRTYLRPGEMLGLFHRWKALYYWEGLGPTHRHGDGPAERHAKVEAVFQKPRGGTDRRIQATLERQLGLPV